MVRILMAHFVIWSRPLTMPVDDARRARSNPESRLRATLKWAPEQPAEY
ncbi:MAG: hypothetical protein ABF581_05460 [Bifidobacterium sp.]